MGRDSLTAYSSQLSSPCAISPPTWRQIAVAGLLTIGLAGAIACERRQSPTESQPRPNLLIVTMEALLIEGLEPPQNRKRGDGFRAVEFLQVEDPEIQRQQAMRIFESLKAKF